VKVDVGDITTGDAFRTGNAYPSGVPDVTSGFHKGSCCPVIRVSFGFWVLIIPFVWLRGIAIFFLLHDVNYENNFVPNYIKATHIILWN